ncbi:helix-turn-helix transcriptional regulator [Saccharibacillus alkalitolerans]|uniref:YafY family transcriptional regulator n=1 Tax=Saccharibacillus alkalitolerans TaxID=2705290 RepID=A0ABX0F6K8_9BACL|nr:YafY family protein [Saccharibacillus alkalitolerans]NGZ76397.1 YafY family transcriptional regulator [Saccharibacillus alkalitolerans]
MKIDRLLAITILLLNRRRISAGELAERFEVSTKTVYRDIETLSRAGIPIVSHQGASGGFELMERYTIGRQMLTPGEIEALRSAVKGAATALDDRTFSDLTEKVQALLGSAGDGASGPGVVFDFNPWSRSVSVQGRIDRLRKAARESLRVEVRYLDMNGRESRRTLEPAMLLMKGGVWYLQAYCLLRGEFRLFRLSRMLELKETGEPFIPKPAPPLEAYEWKDDWDPAPRIEVSLRFRPEVRLRVTDEFDPSRIAELADGSVRVGGSFAADDWFYGMLLSYGDRVIVESPGEIAAELVRRARSIVESYAAQPLSSGSEIR